MLTLEYKLRGRRAQFAAIDEAIRTVQFIRNTCLRLWMDQRDQRGGTSVTGVTANELQTHCAVLARQHAFVAKLNSQARQQAADRAWAAIFRFYANCKAKAPGKKGYPRFQRRCRSVEYKVTGWRLEPDGRHITFTDGHGIGRLRLVGTRPIETFPVEQIKRVRMVRRADGHYVQFCVRAERHLNHTPTGKRLGIDMGLAAFVTDSEGASAPNPRFLRRAEPKLKRLHRRVSRKQKGSKNRQKARKRLARAYLHVVGSVRTMPGSWRARSSRLATGLPTRVCRSAIWSRTITWPRALVTPRGHASSGGWSVMPMHLRSWPWRCRRNGPARTVRAVGAACTSRSRCARIVAHTAACCWIGTIMRR
jgi:transposase